MRDEDLFPNKGKAEAFERLLDLGGAMRRQAAYATDSEFTRERFYTALDVYCIFTQEDQEAVYESVIDALIARHE